MFCQKRNFGLLVFLAVALSLSSCSQGLSRFRRETDDRFLEMRGIQAEHTAAINEMRSEVRELVGKVEELQYVSQGKTRELEQTLQQLGSRVPPPPGVPEELLAKDEARIASIKSPAADQFRRALTLLRSGDFEGSRQILAEFISANPGTAFTDNALFWQGIVYGKLGQPDQAMVSFSDVYEMYPAEDMVAPALFHLGKAFSLAGSREDAKLTFQKVVDGYPRSSFASLAKKELRTLR